MEQSYLDAKRAERCHVNTKRWSKLVIWCLYGMSFKTTKRPDMSSPTAARSRLRGQRPNGGRVNEPVFPALPGGDSSRFCIFYIFFLSVRPLASSPQFFGTVIVGFHPLSLLDPQDNLTISILSLILPTPISGKWSTVWDRSLSNRDLSLKTRIKVAKSLRPAGSRPGESKGGEERNGKFLRMLYAKNNQDSAPGSPMLEPSMGPTYFYPMRNGQNYPEEQINYRFPIYERHVSESQVAIDKGSVFCTILLRLEKGAGKLPTLHGNPSIAKGFGQNDVPKTGRTKVQQSQASPGFGHSQSPLVIFGFCTGIIVLVRWSIAS
ncbi:hypothetical protein PoB_000094300 [Plakobranchus ocellatus]|uniref:Ephrin RBD domain-containing protein n=1 Tax=Plakobranchus ocellatus TaxID=259542 RepID=A0AAV3XWS1_9GAST|nr:hypothetical protein PoB_000094300 [Plakobranchus ocellatus]